MGRRGKGKMPKSSERKGAEGGEVYTQAAAYGRDAKSTKSVV